MSYRPTIGLEIHAELNTKTKMFCDCRNDPDETRPNANICPVCMAHPGTLPVMNKEAVRHVLRVGVALGGTLANESVFDRKSYFYPDIPKGYQISQYERPLVSGGSLAGIAVTRIHLEEDTARSTHVSPVALAKEGVKGTSLVDFNRAGVPLMELVTEPVIHDAKTAGRFARELQLLLRALGASLANLEKGEMRIEANVSVMKEEGGPPAGGLGTKVEIKNLNSFRSVERAIEFEVARQMKRLERGEPVVQETRGWDEAKQETFHQRFKEGSADYRYFPEPDLPKFIRAEIPDFADEVIRASLPELPWEKRVRYETLALKSSDAEYLAASIGRSAFFDAVASELSQDVALMQTAANYIISDLAGWYAKHGLPAGKTGREEYANLSPAAFAKLMRMIADGSLSSRGAKDILTVLAERGGDPEQIAAERGLLQLTDADALRTVVRAILKTHANVADDYRKGKEAALQFLVGQAMKETKGAGSPSLIRELIRENIGK